MRTIRLKHNLASFSFIFAPFKQLLQNKNYSGIRTRIVTLKGKHTDHLTATTAQTFPYSFRQRLLGWFLFHYCDIYVDIFRMQWAGLRQMTRDQCCRTFFMKAWRRKLDNNCGEITSLPLTDSLIVFS